MRSILSVLLARTSAEGWIGNWAPGIGDPTFVGWFTVAAYLVAAYQCWRTYRQLPGAGPGAAVGWRKAAALVGMSLFVSRRRLLDVPVQTRVASLWLGMAAALLLLGINKQLDLQSALTEIGRKMAFAEGWYGTRRVVQAVFIMAVAIAAAWAFRSLLNLAAGAVPRLRPALAGTVFIFAFVVIRAASFHHIDRLLGLRLGEFKLNWLIELGGIAFVAYGARRARHARRAGAAVGVAPGLGPRPRRP